MPSDFDLFFRLILAVVLGGVLGWERETGQKPAGLRTIILVTLGSTLFTLLSIVLAGGSFAGGVNIDPGRIAAGIVTGIGFLGAGAIIHFGRQVGGMTTAAVIWVAAAIGMAAGFGRYFLAASATVLSFIVLRILKKAEKKEVE